MSSTVNMAASPRPYCANSPTLKRSFTAVNTSNPPSPDTAAPGAFKVPALPSKLQDHQHISFFPKRRQSSDQQSTNMPVAAGPQAYQSQFPTFMTVYGLDQDNVEQARARAQDNKLGALGATTHHSRQEKDHETTNSPIDHLHRDSTSTHASESTDSSPTTTISTADSSSLTDPSPSSSPESPVTILPLSSFSATTFGIHSLDDLTMSDQPVEQQALGTITYDRPMTSPSPRKPRNAKGLALKLHGVVDPQQTSAPVSPSFVKPPIPKPRKKPSILSLQTSANANPGLTRLAFEPPPTPGIGRLKHSHSSPQMLFSPDPRGGPDGGMQLPAFQRSRVSGLSTTFRKPSVLKDSNMGAAATIDEEESPIRTQMATRAHGDIGGDIFDAPASHEDAQSPGYPHGPVEIYSPNVYLYLEPTADEAAKFDVIMNVAREVKNPFKGTEASKPVIPSEPKTSFDPMEVDRENIPEPDTAASTATFQTAFEYPPPDSLKTPTESSPTTPKPNSRNFSEPEYFHIPWDHNTDISKDLMDLCETIEARTKEGKRVLVHCQQGASRSASLIIAYGIYMNPTLSVNDAYHAAQAKSKWISPNMKLMYALQDFQKEVERKKLLSVSSGGKGGRHLDRRSPTKHRTTMSADAVDSGPREPQTAPLPSEGDRENRNGLGGMGASTGLTPIRPSSTPDFAAFSPGPSSAPSSYAWTPKGTPDAMGATLGPKTEFEKESKAPESLSGSERQSSETYTSLKVPSQTLRTSVSFTGPSQSSSSTFFNNPTPPPSGFGSHRKEHNLTLPSLSLSSSNSSSSGSSTETTKQSFPVIKPQFATLPSSFSTSQAGIPQTPSLWSPRLQEMTANPLHPVPTAPSMGFGFTADDDVPPTPSIMSPRAAEFSVNPFARTLTSPPAPAAPSALSVSLPQIPNFSRPRPFGLQSPPVPGIAVGGARESAAEQVAASFGFATPPKPERQIGHGFGGPRISAFAAQKAVTPPKAEDPRSPAIQGEVPIVRSIDDVL